MKRVIYLIWFILLLFSTIRAQSGKAKSLEIGNRWIYHAGGSSSFDVERYEVIGTNILNNKTYADILLNTSNHIYERADSTSYYYYYTNCPDSECVEVDYSLELGEMLDDGRHVFYKGIINIWGDSLKTIELRRECGGTLMKIGCI